MFEYLSGANQKKAKSLVSCWLKEFVIKPALLLGEPMGYLSGFDRRKAAQSCYEYLVLAKLMNDPLSQIEKKKLVQSIAMYIDLRTPFIHSRKKFGKPDYQIDKGLFEEIPFQYKSNNLKAQTLIKEAQKSMVLNQKIKWTNEKPSMKQIKLIGYQLKEKRQSLRMKVEEINKYQAAILIPYLLEKQTYDQEELKNVLQ